MPAIRPDSDIRSVLAIESIQTVRLPASALASASARSPGAAPVVTTASGRSRRIARASCQTSRGSACAFLRETLMTG